MKEISARFEGPSAGNRLLTSFFSDIKASGLKFWEQVVAMFDMTKDWMEKRKQTVPLPSDVVDRDRSTNEWTLVRQQTERQTTPENEKNPSLSNQEQKQASIFEQLLSVKELCTSNVSNITFGLGEPLQALIKLYFYKMLFLASLLSWREFFAIACDAYNKSVQLWNCARVVV